MATHLSILAGKIPWTGEPGRLQSMGLQRVRHDCICTHEHTHTHTHTTYCVHQRALEMCCIRTGTRHRKVSCMSGALWGEVSSFSEKGNQPSRHWSAEPLPWGWGLASANTGPAHFCSGWSLVSLPVDSGPCHMNSFSQGRYVSSHQDTQRFYFMLKYLCIHLTELSLNCSIQGF